MKTTGNTILITGGSAGIGFEIAKIFSEKGNNVIITGRNEARLTSAAGKLKNTTAIVSDVADKQDVEKLVATLKSDFPNINIVINNAGAASYYLLDQVDNTYERAEEEIVTNYLSIIGLNQKLLPLLGAQKEAAIVNVSSIAALVPNHVIPTYAASKAALHSYTQSLRLTLAKATAVKVFELMPPLVNTEFSTEIGGENGIPASEVAEALINAFDNDTYEIHVGRTADLFGLFRQSPEQALLAMNPGSAA
ncbi:SDR family NAD(P)-dependent oxidoreductase [Dyadobacter chenwenxiniae]|uniref:SDR family NAD(P)-dependent oxidoreductase n=1 Tax=Dyadobacter chenwenxiniae TaxID=2906456 RepID=A0A9X1TFZ8_9BACT|nr:SDR family NAD(P)-dependent oxidoreductase [Dyadobacter chenwenxiniae]MCF0064856.1 SDR family NAD(P)-dependent oxidoreductase [Dyadobacter chenwenxiniae]UON82979.1 SDR family NAD(P)-dependent oxidoreductase [Dyadobacter chenwenxiniae]